MWWNSENTSFSAVGLYFSRRLYCVLLQASACMIQQRALFFSIFCTCRFQLTIIFSIFYTKSLAFFEKIFFKDLAEWCWCKKMRTKTLAMLWSFSTGQEGFFDWTEIKKLYFLYLVLRQIQFVIITKLGSEINQSTYFLRQKLKWVILLAHDVHIRLKSVRLRQKYLQKVLCNPTWKWPGSFGYESYP